MTLLVITVTLEVLLGISGEVEETVRFLPPVLIALFLIVELLAEHDQPLFQLDTLVIEERFVTPSGI
ncbi:MAG TPA: hypothetical protein VK983_03715 [Candidatus Limnocylindrales bacterium]|nr:hypothetical protein [Candidatus Limnocylindrales bacterium]